MGNKQRFAKQYPSGSVQQRYQRRVSGIHRGICNPGLKTRIVNALCHITYQVHVIERKWNCRIQENPDSVVNAAACKQEAPHVHLCHGRMHR